MITVQFGTLSFWVFFCIFLGVYQLVRQDVSRRNLLLLTASYVLYALWNGWLLAILVLSTLVAYYAAIAITRSRHAKRILIAAVVFQLGMLVVFKYTGFFVHNFEQLLRLAGYSGTSATLKFILPIGLSFYTFSIIDYVVQVYRKKVPPEKNFIVFALFVAFFPKLMAGPVERAAHLLPQCREVPAADPDRMLRALHLVTWGVIQKFCIADNASFLMGKILGVQGVAGLSIFLIFSIWIYADFSGYTDIARGIAGVLGFDLLENFRMPYLATNISDFWRRWHMSMSDWFRDYVYIPLGGSRSGLARTMINLFITMVLVGFWHGADWTYIIWGAYHGLLLALHRLLVTWRSASAKRSFFTASPVLGTLCTFAAVSFGWLFFSVGDLESAGIILKNLYFSIREPYLLSVLILLSPIALMHALQIWKKDGVPLSRLPWWTQTAFFLLAFYALILMPPFTPESFIYVSF